MGGLVSLDMTQWGQKAQILHITHKLTSPTCLMLDEFAAVQLFCMAVLMQGHP